MGKTTVKKVNTLKAHISLNVRDVEQSVGFYKRMFGLEPLKFIKEDTTVHSVLQDDEGHDSSRTRSGYAKFDVENPPLNLVLNEVPFAAGGTLSHLGIQVASTDDVLAMRELWAETGLLTRDEMQIDCCYAVQDKTWTRDPDGNEWEVFVVLEDTNQAVVCGCGDAAVNGNQTVTAEPVAVNQTNAACCAPSCCN